MDEVNRQSIDVGGELVESVQPRFPGAPVVTVGPIRGKFPRVLKRNALAPVVDALSLRPSGPGQPLAQVVENVVGDSNPEWFNCEHGSSRPHRGPTRPQSPARGRPPNQGLSPRPAVAYARC